MDLREIALQLTLKAIDKNNIHTKGMNDGTAEDVNAFNAKQIADFYNSVYSKINTDLDFSAQTY